jgi:hypothetical protein
MRKHIKALSRFSGLDETGASEVLGLLCEDCMSQTNMKISQKDHPSCKGLSNGLVDVMAVAETLDAEEAFAGSH